MQSATHSVRKRSKVPMLGAAGAALSPGAGCGAASFSAFDRAKLLLDPAFPTLSTLAAVRALGAIAEERDCGFLLRGPGLRGAAVPEGPPALAG